MFLSIGMLKQKYFLTDIFILSAEKQPIKLSWRKIEWLRGKRRSKISPTQFVFVSPKSISRFAFPSSVFHFFLIFF